MDNNERINEEVLNKIIAFKLLELAYENGMIEEKKHQTIERRRNKFNENIVKTKGLCKGD